MKHPTGFSLRPILIGILLMLAMSNAMQVQAQPAPPIPDATRSGPASVGIPAPLAPFSPLAPNTRTLRVISWDSTRGRDDMILTDTSAGRNITRVYAALMNPANFGPEGVSKCAPGISYVNAIPTGSLVSGGVRQADVFFGNMINPNSPVPLSASEAAELVAFLNAGGIVYISGDGHGQGTPWNPLFVALGISDRFASDYITSGSVSLPLVVTPLTNGPFGAVGYMGWTPYSTITTATLTKVITAGGASYTMVAEGAVGAGYLSVTGDTVAHDFNTSSTANLRYMLNLFAKGCQAPKLLIHQDVEPQVPAAGQSVTLVLHIANLSNTPIADVVITDILPLQLTNTSFKSSGLTLTPVGATPYIWQAGVLAPQASGIITITGTIAPGESPGTAIVHTASIAGTDGVSPITDSTSATLHVQDCYATADNGVTVHRDLQAAIDAAPANGTVKVAGYCGGMHTRNNLQQIAYIDKPLTLRGGYAPNQWSLAGAATYPTTLDAFEAGRVMWVTEGLAVTVQDLKLTNGRVLTSGAGISAQTNSALTLRSVQLINNTTTGGSGGGLFASGTLNADQTQFIGNQAFSYGGGAGVSGAANITGGIFRDNAAGSGGGLISYRALALSGAQFIDNSATDGGGVYAYGLEGGQIHVVNTLFARNAAVTNGAALHLFSGGASTSEGQILHNTIVSATPGVAPAIYASSGTIGINNTIIAGYATGIQQAYSSVISQDYNLFYNTTPTGGTVSGGAHSLTGDPKFVGPNQDNYHLLVGSPAIDHGLNLGVTTDLEHRARPYGSAPDIGAYEWVDYRYASYLPLTLRGQ
jgi:uncharacterized repeat protein (TIGR01451 family)